ncbi:MAG: type IV secretory system conjugative DNA transfer family protein [bacterium]|nr:type IV secretory system conjugative DNA transfer family protein [bacterium]
MTTFFDVLFSNISAHFDSNNKQGIPGTFGDESLFASSWNKGFVVSRDGRLTRRQSYENVLLVGATGSGKTSRFLLPTLLSLKNCSIVVNDPSKELYNLASGYLSKYFKLKTLNFSDSSISSGYNILSRIKKPNDIFKIASILVSATLEKGSSGGDPFWSLQTKTLLSILLRLIQLQPEAYRNMANVSYLLSIFSVKPKIIDAMILNTKDKSLILEFKSLIATPDKTLQNITSSAKASLQIFSDPEIAKVTSVDTISFEELRQVPTVIFLHNSIADQKYASTLNSLFFQQFYEFVLSKLPTKNDLDIMVILEEASSLYIPVLPVSLANTRKHFVSNLICIQAPQQLDTNYGKDAENIVNNCVTKCFLPGITNLSTLKDIETLGGTMHYTDTNGKEKTKKLLTVEEIRMMHKDQVLILCANHPFVLAKTKPFYQSFKYSRRASYPPAPFNGEINQTPIRLIGESTNEEGK